MAKKDLTGPARSGGRFTIDRRSALKLAGGAAGVAALGSVFPAPAVRAADTLKLGWVSPKTGPLAPFAESDEFTIAAVRNVVKDGIKSGGKSYQVEIVVKDSQSNPNRAAEVASDLILSDEVDLLVVGNTPETTNPVGDQAELNGVPCISSLAPWQPWFFTRGGDPAKGFKYTWHFFWGLEDVIGVFTNMWNSIPTNKMVGGLFPNDGDGNSWGDAKLGFPPVLDSQGFKLLDPGRYQNLTDDFSAQIAAFKGANVEIVTGVMIPPDFTTFWTQARQQGFVPKIASMGKAILFPVAVEALGKQGNNLTSEVWWSPNHPFSSSLTGQSSMQLAQAYTQSTGKQWTQPIGFAHALFEVAIDVLKRSADPKDAEANLAAIASTDLQTIVGPVAWGSGPVKNVAKTPLVGGQWRLTDGGKFPYELLVVNNQTAPQIPAQGELQPIS
ncbi:MAG: ABC transporter substrate-binding protein [Sneathiellaceae bacterium]